MDVLHPPSINDSFDYDYYEYYNSGASVEFAPCMKHQAREFSQLFLPVFYSITCVLGFIANFILITLFLKSRSLRKAFPLSMVSADLLFTLTLPFWAVYSLGEWIFGYPACKALTFVYMVGLYASNLFVGCMILQKYLDMVSSFGNTIQKKTILCILLWFLSVVASSPHLYFAEAHEFHGKMICTNNFSHKMGWRIYTRFQMIVLGFCVPLLVLVVSSFVVGRSLKRSRTWTPITGLTLLFFLLWFPYILVILLHALQELHVISECVTSLHLDLAIVGTECIAFMHVYLNPVAYVLLNKRIWRKFRIRCTTQRDPLLGSSDSTESESSQENTMELKALQRFSDPESDGFNAEHQGHFLPHVT